ncbi:MAG: hypothetical protein PHV95_03955 [Eubacteriales bacterium]|nr:hypothetical protein [Eubacteriales bacterium]
MSKSNLPSVRLNVYSEWFNVLMSVLEFNNTHISDDDISEEASQLMEKLFRYTRAVQDSKGEDCTDIRFYPNEASNVIFQLLVYASSNVKIDNRFYSELIQKRLASGADQQSKDESHE